MSEPSQSSMKTSIALLAGPDATASALYGMYDLFGSAGRDWEFLTRGRMGSRCSGR